MSTLNEMRETFDAGLCAGSTDGKHGQAHRSACASKAEKITEVRRQPEQLSASLRPRRPFIITKATFTYIYVSDAVPIAKDAWENGRRCESGCESAFDEISERRSRNQVHSGTAFHFPRDRNASKFTRFLPATNKPGCCTFTATASATEEHPPEERMPQ